MTILELCERIQDTWVSRSISESTWGYPLIGALHVLAIALFGGSVLASHFRLSEFAVHGRQLSNLAVEVRWIRRLGFTLVAVTGTLVFASGAVRYYQSSCFRIKMVLLVLIALNAIIASRQHGKLHSSISLALWAALIFASRGIAFF
jgi:hypothetical protein